MYYYLAHIPKLDPTDIDKVRSQFDPNFQFVPPHIAVVFPVDSAIGKDNLIRHIDDVLNTKESFEYSLRGLTKSWDHYLYLEVDNGRSQFVNLRDQLYTGILVPYLFKVAGFNPHITLGFFADRQANFDMSDINSVVFDQSKYDLAIAEATKQNFNYNLECSEFTLISRVDKSSPAVIEHTFSLQGQTLKVAQ
jgi:2'-5' RNA ligase